MTVTLANNPVQLLGELPAVGQKAPEFTAVKGDLSIFKLSDLAGKRVVLNIFPSLDTEICAASVRRFNKEASELDNTVVVCVSKDLPFAQSRFCTTEGLKNVIPVSVFRDTDFDKGYGLLMTDGPLAGIEARAVVVIDEAGQISYEEVVSEIKQDPNFEAALAVLK